MIRSAASIPKKGKLVRMAVIIELVLCVCASSRETQGIHASSSQRVGRLGARQMRDPGATEKKLKFKRVAAGSGVTADGSETSFQIYEASDGVKVWATIQECGSSSRSRRELEKQL